jgi:hypothetical protein
MGYKADDGALPELERPEDPRLEPQSPSVTPSPAFCLKKKKTTTY